jgi:hypothetical protein
MTIAALDGKSDFATPTGATPRADAAIEAVTPHLSDRWKL